MKKILSIIAIALVAFLGYGFLQAGKLQNIQITKSVTINTSKKEAIEMVQYLNNFPKWSPFLVQDPTIKYTLKGTDGTVGAQYHWVGNGGDDVGYQEIVKIDTASFVGMRCDIQKPFVAHPTFDYTFTQTTGGVEVTQDFKLESGLVDAFFLWAFGAKAGMEATNQQGMELLKKALEK